MDIAKSFTFMFQDTEWLRKLGIGTLVMLIGLILFPVLIGLIPLIIVLGYTIDVTRNVLDGRVDPLPEWEDWGGLFVRGLKLFGIFLIWSLPFIVGVIPFGIGSALANSNSDAGFLASMFFFCGSCLSILWGLVLLLVSPAIYVHLARTDSFGAGFDFAWLWSFTRDNITNVIVAILLSIVAAIIASIVGMLGVIAIVIGLIVTIPLSIFWQMLVQAHLFGQTGVHSASITE